MHVYHVYIVFDACVGGAVQWIAGVIVLGARLSRPLAIRLAKFFFFFFFFFFLFWLLSFFFVLLPSAVLALIQPCLIYRGAVLV
jgi:hypothetical protein